VWVPNISEEDELLHRLRELKDKLRKLTVFELIEGGVFEVIELPKYVVNVKCYEVAGKLEIFLDMVFPIPPSGTLNINLTLSKIIEALARHRFIANEIITFGFISAELTPHQLNLTLVIILPQVLRL